MFPCKSLNCPELLEQPGFCKAHQDQGHQQKTARNRLYDTFSRDKVSDQFYHSARWKYARGNYIAQHPICEQCQLVIAQHVHHKIPLAVCTPEQQIDPDNLMSVCIPCHLKIEGDEPELETPIGTLSLQENERWYYDAEAAERPIRFIQKYFRHYEGRKFAGKPFTLIPWQVQLVKNLFGWKDRTTGLRRFKEVYLISAKGAGKTPLMTMIGLYMGIADDEPAPHVVSIGASFEQAGLTFNSAKLYLEESELSKHRNIDWNKFTIDLPRHGKWTMVSGKNKGRSGTRPNCILADEIHEYDPQAVKNYLTVTANLFKRSQPILFNSTNAGENKQHFSYGVHERACKVLNGEDDPTLLPYIFEAPKTLDWRSEAAARAANPSIPDIVTFDQIKPEQNKGGKPVSSSVSVAMDRPGGKVHRRRSMDRRSEYKRHPSRRPVVFGTRLCTGGRSLRRR